VVHVLTIDPLAPDAAIIAEAARVLAGGGLVAFPTETVYGLGARGLRPEHVAKIFAAKNRPKGHPLILHVDGEAMARPLARSWPARASRLAAELWPGPLTMIVDRGASVPPEVTGGLDTVAVRAPKHAVALALLSAVGEPLAAPSANAHTHVSPTTAAHVVRSLGERVDLVLDAGPCEHGIESTVVTVSDPPRVLRPGAVGLARLCAIDPSFVYEPMTVAADTARAAPGLAAKHYAPRTRLVLRPSSEIGESVARGAVGAIVWSASGRASAAGASRIVVLPDDAAGYARRLFAALHELDDAELDVIVVEAVPRDEAWWAVADRLARAARRVD
jgi:L-threonylcarbamoyladenylate synthase